MSRFNRRYIRIRELDFLIILFLYRNIEKIERIISYSRIKETVESGNEFAFELQTRFPLQLNTQYSVVSAVFPLLLTKIFTINNSNERCHLLVVMNTASNTYSIHS